MIDRVHRIPRLWSNQELGRFAHLFRGDVVNVSGWTDTDKQGRCYKDYFRAAQTCTITNFESDKRGYQGSEGEVFLDLTKPLDPYLVGRFDLVFNHTTLEHIFDVNTAFHNLCAMSNDVVILVVPFLQPQHSHYGDYWRFTPEAVIRMFERESLTVAYLNFNDHFRSSVYIFSIAVKDAQKWRGLLPFKSRLKDEQRQFLNEPFAGCNGIHRDRWSALMCRFPRVYRLLKRRQERG